MMKLSLPVVLLTLLTVAEPSGDKVNRSMSDKNPCSQGKDCKPRPGKKCDGTKGSCVDVGCGCSTSVTGRSPVSHAVHSDDADAKSCYGNQGCCHQSSSSACACAPPNAKSCCGGKGCCHRRDSLTSPSQ
jgi:hypothetical protein